MALIYDVARKQIFQMKTTLTWAINDFSTCRMVLRYSTHGKLFCLYCMENNKAFTLTNDGKTSFCDCHLRFLKSSHRYRKNKKYFLKGKFERNIASLVLSGDELNDVVS